MNSEEVEAAVRKNVSWTQLPNCVKQNVGNSAKEYDKCILHFSLKNQIRYKGSLVQRLRKDESQYYEDLLAFGWKNLLLFPYHLSDVIIKGLGTTPFNYYINMLDQQMANEKSYDSLPNFTAADCLRLIGIGRNQYIELMNSCRSNKRFGIFKKSAKELLPTKPLDTVPFLPWWYVQVAYITEEDMKNAVDKAEHCLIDQIIDDGSGPVGYLNYQTVKQLFNKGFIYFDVPIEDDDYVVVPPLEGFVMNRVQGDFFETLLYKIFVSIDENTTVSELSKILEVDLNLVKHAVSLYCRLGFAKKKNSEMDSSDIHPSWYTGAPNAPKVKTSGRSGSVSSDEDDSLLKELNQALEVDDDDDVANALGMEVIKSPDDVGTILSGHAAVQQKKIGFLFDSTLTAYLMMGNLSVGLKTHAVTMFEVGKLGNESLDSLVSELEGISTEDGEGEAARYYLHARNLKQTIQFLRSNQSLKLEDDSQDMCLPLDLLRCESLQSLDQGTASRLLSKHYRLLISMAPLMTNEIRPSKGNFPPHLGPASPEVSSIWFKMFLYNQVKCGPPSLLLPKGYKISRLPKVFDKYNRLIVTSWGHEPSEIPIAGALSLLLEALQHSAILVQASNTTDSEIEHIPFPLSTNDQDRLTKKLGLWEMLPPSVIHACNSSCGYITLITIDPPNPPQFRGQEQQPLDGVMKMENALLLQRTLEEEVDSVPTEQSKKNNLMLEEVKAERKEYLLGITFGIPLFDSELNKAICQRIVINNLWKNDNLATLEKSGQELSEKLSDFINEFQDKSLVRSVDKICMTPEDRRKTPVALPSKLLFFDGTQIHDTF